MICSGGCMAPSPSLRLLQALLCAPRLASIAPKSSLLPFLPSCPRASTPWQCLLRSFSAGRDGGDGDRGDGFDPFGKAPLFGGAEKRTNGGDDNEEPRLFGEGGLFGQSRRPSDDQQEDETEEPPPWTHIGVDEKGYDAAPEYEAREGGYGEQAWSSTAEPGYSESMGAGFTPGEPVGREGFEGGTQEWKGDAEQGWFQQEDTAKQLPAYIGEWGPDGRLIRKAKPQPLFQEHSEAYSPTAGDAVTDAAFGDLIKKSGFTDDDIANLMAGFYEPVGLPHLDDYKFVDIEAERKKQRREMELAKMAEMAKRWVKKVDEHGFAHGVGRRKASRARVWIREGEGRIVVNRLHHDMYFTFIHNRVEYMEPFVVTDTLGMFDTFVLVRGGGVSGQASAIRHGLSRALMWYDPSLRAPLKKAGMLRRDDRVVERKKPGKAKARKSFQWVKR